MYIAVAGNIGCGKTSLVEILAERCGMNPYYESIDNPYLDDFYKDMKEWSFKLQISFLASKIAQMRSINNEQCNVIQDRTVYEEAMVFVKNLNNMLLLSQRDFNTYLKIYDLMLQGVKEPDLVIYLKGDVSMLVSQIKKRGRDYEQNIQTEYLEKLNELYDDWVLNQYEGNKIIIEVNDLDFVDNKEDLEKLLSLLEDKAQELGFSLYKKEQ